MDQSTIIEMIRQLKNKTTEKGATEAEALEAMRKISELMGKYNVTLTEVLLNNEKCSGLNIKTGKRRKSPLDYVVTSIGRFSDCEAWHEKRAGETSYTFFGMKQDTLMCNFLFDLITNAVETETEKFKNTQTYIFNSHSRKTLSTSFQKGMVIRIAQRLDELTELRHRAEKQEILNLPRIPGAAVASGTSIIVLKNNKVKQELAELGMKFQKPQMGQQNIHQEAYNNGKQRGDSVNLSRPIGNNNSNPLLIGN